MVSDRPEGDADMYLHPHVVQLVEIVRLRDETTRSQGLSISWLG